MLKSFERFIYLHYDKQATHCILINQIYGEHNKTYEKMYKLLYALGFWLDLLFIYISKNTRFFGIFYYNKYLCPFQLLSLFFDL